VARGTSALVRDGARDTVFVVEDGVARQRAVRTGAQGDALVEVLDGVRVGERVVVRDADRLRDGQRVEEAT
jgi:HlyD family secretion protein